MSVEVTRWVFRHSKSKLGARLVLLAMADEASSEGELTAYRRSQAWIATKCNMDVRSVRRCVDQLVELGELEVLNEGTGRTKSDYKIPMREDTVSALDEQKSPGREDTVSAPSPRSFPLSPIDGELAVRKTRRSRLPEGWTPGEAEIKASTSAGMNVNERRFQWQMFRDHHKAKGSTMADWPAAWRTWCGNWRKFNPEAAKKADLGGHRLAGTFAFRADGVRITWDDQGNEIEAPE